MNTAKYLWLLLGFLLYLSAGAQNFVLSNEIPVAIGNRSLKAAWAGGLNAPQMGAIDLDNNSILDLVIFDRDGDRLLTFLNGGTAGEIDYTFAPQYIAAFPSGLGDWVILRDFDADGYVDLFTAIPNVSNVRVYRNTSASTGGTLSFALHQDTVMTNYPPALPLYSGRSDYPAVDDIDGDGDLDFLTFQLGGTKVEWHKNLSVENTGGLNQILYSRKSRCFGHFEEDVFGCAGVIGQVPCGAGERMEERADLEAKALLHAGSTMLSLDLDSNGLKDLLIGDISCATLYGLYNGGTSAIANFITYDPHFPAADTAVRVLIFPAAYYLDIDNDAIKDLLVAPNQSTQIEDQTSIQFFKNARTDPHPDFKFQRYGILQDEMIDIGTSAMPAFLDYDGNGLIDLLVGGAGRYDSLVGYFPLLKLYKNVGTAQQPAFSLVSSDYMNLRNHPAFANASQLHPAAGDLDGDGDQDLLLGNADGAIFHFNNVAGSGNPASFNLLTSNFSNIDVGFNSAPQLIDLDADQDLDLVVGNHLGYIHYYNNVGSITAPNFVLVSDTFGQVKVNNFSGQTASNGYSQPFVCDYDADSDLDLLVGAIDGDVQIFENINLIPGAAFTRVADLMGRDFGSYASPAAAILDSARLSFVVGDHRGGLTLLRPGGPVGMVGPTEQMMPQIQLFPNPADDQISFAITGNAAKNIDHYRVLDVYGRLCATGKIQSPEGTIAIADLSAGVYNVAFGGRNTQVTRRIIVRH